MVNDANLIFEMLNVVILCCVCIFSECHYADCHNSARCNTKCFLVCALMLRVVIPSVIMHRHSAKCQNAEFRYVSQCRVQLHFAIMLSVIRLIVVAPQQQHPIEEDAF
jgi:hypothetical protein